MIDSYTDREGNDASQKMKGLSARSQNVNKNQQDKTDKQTVPAAKIETVTSKFLFSFVLLFVFVFCLCLHFHFCFVLFFIKTIPTTAIKLTTASSNRDACCEIFINPWQIDDSHHLTFSWPDAAPTRGS